MPSSYFTFTSDVTLGYLDVGSLITLISTSVICIFSLRLVVFVHSTTHSLVMLLGLVIT